MVIVMGMESGKHIEDEFGAFEEEVLNAQWLPQPAQLQLGVQKATSSTVSRSSRSAGGMDAEAFLRNMYLSQE